jgi:hypothetical protein
MIDPTHAMIDPTHAIPAPVPAELSTVIRLSTPRLL